MTKGEYVLILVAGAIGIILSFTMWQYIAPMIAPVTPTPTA